MRALKLFEDFHEARFIARPNRFTLMLDLAGREVRAYLPNTGRLEEYMVEGGVFYITASRTEKFSFKAVSACYRGSPVLLDTRRINDLTEVLLGEKALTGFEGFSFLERERALGDIRPDFTLTGEGGKTCFLEVKSCTLCHRGVALFPDAPSARASRHIERLAGLSGSGTSAAMVFLVPHGGWGVSFMPNFHTDREFTERALLRSLIPGHSPADMSENGRFRFRAYRIPLIDPVTADLDGVREIAIDWERARAHCTNAGSYVLVLRNDEDRSCEVGRLGPTRFRKGYYAYVGSALSSLDARVARHLRKRKKPFWHIDAITSGPMAVEKTFPIRRTDRIEGAIAGRIGSVCDSPVSGFGASDAAEGSRLFYFTKPPHRLRPFLDVIFDFRTFTENMAFPDECR